jgi:hypothetical protein
VRVVAVRTLSLTYVAEVVEVVEDRFVDFHKHNLVLDTAGEAGFFGLLAGFDHDEGLALDVSLVWGLHREAEGLSASRVDEEERGAPFEVVESRTKGMSVTIGWFKV